MTATATLTAPKPKATLKTMQTASDLTEQLTSSLRRPTRKTLRLIDRAISLLAPYESAHSVRCADTTALLTLLTTHRLTLSPYLDTARIERNLRS